MILSATGHRPDKLGGYDAKTENALRLLAHRKLVELRPDEVITGMALGWDQSVASAAMLAGIPFVAAIPFETQERKWPAHAQKVYREILAAASRVEIVSTGGYANWKYQKRNAWMVDNSDSILALWNGTAGGTANCVGYAGTKHKPIINLWNEWIASRV